jgi:hypothetical protein
MIPVRTTKSLSGRSATGHGRSSLTSNAETR